MNHGRNCTFPEVEYLVRRPGRRLALPNEAALPACCGWDMATESCEGEPWMESQWLPVSLVVWITALAGTLDARQQARFVQLCTGLLFARGRRTVTSWLRAAAWARYKRYYYLLGSVGRKTPAIARALLRILLKRLPGDGAGTPLVFAIDDSPTKRYGPHVEGVASITTRPQGRPGPSSSTATSGSVWPGWSDIRFGGRSPCRSSRTCISEPRMSAGWRPTTAGSSTRSWARFKSR